MEIQEDNTSLKAIIHEKYPFLNEKEIKDFVECHPWLNDEKDSSILEEYIIEYFQGLAVRYNSIVDSVTKKPAPQGEKNKKNEDKKEQEPIADNADENKDSGNNFEQLLTSIQELHQDLFELKGQREQFVKIVRFLETLLDNLIKNSKDPAHRQVELIDPQLKEDNLIVILNSLGFDITLFTDSEILLVLNTEPSEDFLSIASDTIKSLYTQNPQFMEEVNSDPLVRQRLEAQRNAVVEREHDRAGFLASVHEQRVQQRTGTNTVNRIGGQNPSQDQVRNQIYNTNTYLPDPSNARNQIDDYRARMRNRFLEGRSFSGGNNMMTLTDMNNRERQSDQVPRASNGGFGSRVVTASDIEKKRIEEDKVKFGVRALELTNQFRKSNGLPPLVWSQELCDVGMEHSKDMAEGRVPFGHHGFNNRCKKVKFHHRSMAENVAYNTGYSDPPKTAVEGWITSPGHRKNLLSNSNVCAISCYRAPNGSWYFTQLFALRT